MKLKIFLTSSGSSQGIAAIENIMEHIAFAVNRDPLKVRQVNFIHKGDPLIGVPGAKFMSENFIPKMLQEILQSSDYLNRKKSIEVFNQVNIFFKLATNTDMRLTFLPLVYFADHFIFAGK